VAVRYVPSDRWSLRSDGELLILSAGADEIYAIEDCTADAAAELTAAWEREAIDSASLSADAGRLVGRLVAAGIVEPELPAGRAWRVALRYVGDRPRPLERAFLAALESSLALEPSEPGCGDLAVVVRTNGRLTDLYDGTPEPGPHLLLDVAFDHTVSLGPLVFPGDTACLGCLAGRIGRYWGDAPPPAAPTVQRHATLVASLLALALEKVAAGDTGLVNETVSWDLRRWEIARNAVYKLPWCPFCGEERESLGSIDLPWARTG
jgi:hypothetical protein